MISLLLILLAAAFNALMDLVENENYSRSIFSQLPTQFWYKRESWKSALKLAGYKFDAWHIAKSFMITCLCLAIVCYQPAFRWWIDFLIAGAGWNLSFNLCYNKLFIKKPS